MLHKIQRNEEEKLHQEGVIAYRYKRLRKKILLNLSLEDINVGAFLVPIPNREMEEKLASLQGFQQHFPSSPPMPPKDSQLDDDMVLLDVEGELMDASDIESSNDDFFHIQQFVILNYLGIAIVFLYGKRI